MGRLEFWDCYGSFHRSEDDFFIRINSDEIKHNIQQDFL